MEVSILAISKFCIAKEHGMSVIKDILNTSSDHLLFSEYLRNNMETFVQSRKNAKELYKILKEKGIFNGSYRWFTCLYARERARFFKIQESGTIYMEKEGKRENRVTRKKSLPTAGKNESQERKDHLSMEEISDNREEKEEAIPEQQYRLKSRVDLEVPVDEIQEAINAGARIDEEWGDYTGVIFAPGNRDARRFQKWLPRKVSEKYGLEYREKDKIATKTEVLELIPELDLIFVKERGL
jgi:hypothetical protein